MTQFDQEEMLRRALHAVADTIEPAADGLERIRARLSRPHPLAVAWILAAWTSLAQPALLRMEPVVSGIADRLLTRVSAGLRLVLGSLSAAAGRLGPAAERWLVSARRLRPGSGMSRHEKLRSAMAFGAAAVIGAAGGFALSAGLPQQMISAASSFIAPSQPNHAPGGGNNPGTNGSGHHITSAPGSTPHGKATPSTAPSPSCSPKPRPSPSSPSPSPSSPSPSPSSPSPSPSSPSPSPSSPSPSSPGPTSSQGAGGAGSSPAASHTSAVSHTSNLGIQTGVVSPAAAPSKMPKAPSSPLATASSSC